MYVFMHVCIHTCVCVCVCVCVCTLCIHMYIHTHTHTSTHIHYVLEGIREQLGWVELNYNGNGVYSDGCGLNGDKVKKNKKQFTTATAPTLMAAGLTGPRFKILKLDFKNQQRVEFEQQCQRRLRQQAACARVRLV